MKSARPLVRFVALAVVGGALAPHSVRAQDTTAAIHYKGLTVTPIGFAAAEAVVRARNLTADIGSSYGAIPFDNTTAAHMSEFRATGRQSRIGFLFQGNAGDNKLTGYWEADFLGVGIASNSNESNSYVLRIRQYFGQVTTKDNFSFDGGQMWSLATPGKSGVLPRGEWVPLTIEAQYAVGFQWARQPGFRVSQQDGAMSWGLALEGAQTTFSARNAPANLVIGQTGGSLLNATQNYSTDLAPDLIAKLAFDPKGKGHYELKAVGRLFRNRLVDATGTNGGTSSRSAGAGGVGFGIYYPVMHDGRDVVDLGLSGLAGVGIGRYGTSGLSDATIGADSTIKPIKSAFSLLSIETHPTSSLDVYGYGGVEYADRTDFTIAGATPKGAGYGSPLNNVAGCEVEAAPTGPYAPASGTCAADTRSFWQGNLGFWYRFYRGSAGTVQYGMQYSYTKKSAWSGAGGEPTGNDSMIFASFRWVIP